MDKELKSYLEDMREDLSILKSDMKDIRGDIKELKSDLKEVAQSVNALANHVDDRFDEIAPALAKVENHEKRIQYLENNALPKTA